MSENIVINCSIDNRTEQPLKPQSVNLPHGKWDDIGNHPPYECLPGRITQAFKSSGTRGSARGTEGTVVYRLGDNIKETITISWDLPWKTGAANTLSILSFDEDVKCTVTSWVGHGAGEAPIITVVDRR